MVGHISVFYFWWLVWYLVQQKVYACIHLFFFSSLFDLHMFFKLSWPEPVLLNGMACTWTENFCLS